MFPFFEKKQDRSEIILTYIDTASQLSVISLGDSMESIKCDITKKQIVKAINDILVISRFAAQQKIQLVVEVNSAGSFRINAKAI